MCFRHTWHSLGFVQNSFQETLSHSWSYHSPLWNGLFFHLLNPVISVYISTPTWFPSRHLPSCLQSEWVRTIPTAYWCLHHSTCSGRFIRFNLRILSLVFLLTRHHVYHDAYWKMASLATSCGRYPLSLQFPSRPSTANLSVFFTVIHVWPPYWPVPKYPACFLRLLTWGVCYTLLSALKLSLYSPWRYFCVPLAIVTHVAATVP